jgi:hypothetical protein
MVEQVSSQQTSAMRPPQNEMTGGWTKQETSNEMVDKAVKVAEQELMKRSNSMGKLQVDQVLSAKTQVVNGINYVIELQVKQGEGSSRQRVYLHQTPQGVITFTKHEKMD